MNDPENPNPNPGGPSPAEDLPLRLGSRRAAMQKVFERLEKEAPPQPKVLTNSTGMKLVLMPAATFLMGAPPEEGAGRQNEGPPHEVVLTQAFYLSTCLVTQAQYLDVMKHNPARFNRTGGGGPEHPVENVSWEDAVLFCKRLADSTGERQTGLTYRLPTEAEWEYACRGGTRTPFAFGEHLSARDANFDDRRSPTGASPGHAVGKTTPVATYAANNFGLYDTHGNLWEWCADWYDGVYYAHSPARDPQGPPTGQFRVVRGGCWRNQAATCRAAYRNALVPNNRDIYTGFRVVAVNTAKP